MKELAWKITADKKTEGDVNAVLLFGSVSTENIHPDSDLDIVVVKDSKENLMKRNESLIEGIKVDLWEHSSHFYVSLFKKDWQPKEMFWYSLFLNILQGCRILYDRESKFENHRKNAMHWRWPKDCKDLIKDKLQGALSKCNEVVYDRFERLVYLRKMFLLDTCSRLLDIGKPVSIRNKDYYLKCKEYFCEKDFKSIFGKSSNLAELQLLFKTSMNLFNSEVKNKEPWTELKDAKSHISNGERFMAAISLQNGAYYIGSVGLSNRRIKRDSRGFLYPESEIEIIVKSKAHWKEFHNFYRKVHNVDAWSDGDIDSISSQILSRLQ